MPKKLTHQKRLVLVICALALGAHWGWRPIQAPATAPATEGHSLVFVVPIRQMVSPGMRYHVQRAITAAEQQNADLLLLHMNTPGGRVDSARQISEALLKTTLPTATFIDPDAISAGSLIALSTKKIITVKNGLIGCSKPILPGGEGGMQPADEKVVSYVRGLFSNAAKQNGYPVDIALGMVDQDMEVRGPDGEIISPQGKLLTLDAPDMVKYGIAKAIASDCTAAVEALGFSKPDFVEAPPDWAELLAQFLADPVVSSILLMIGLAGLYLEYKSPGMVLPAVAAVAAFMLMFWANSIAHLTGYEALICVVLGLILLGVEIFVLPGFGIAGVAGCAVLIIGLLLVMAEHPVYVPEVGVNPEFSGEVLVGAAAKMVAGLCGSIVLFLLLVRFVDRSKFVHEALVLESTVSAGQGYVSTDESEIALTGKAGYTVGALRPAGIVDIGGERVDAVSEGEWIPPGRRVRVACVEGRRIIVVEEHES